MRLWPGGLAVRLAVAAVAAVGGVFVLQHVVVARERDVTARPSPRLLPTASPLHALGFRLLPTGGEVIVASRLEAIPPDVAPVLQLLADGSLAVRRSPRLATTPGRRTDTAVAIVVPRAAIANWSPAARGALVELLATWLEARPAGRERLRLVDVPLGERELQTLLTWLP